MKAKILIIASVIALFIIKFLVVDFFILPKPNLNIVLNCLETTRGIIVIRSELPGISTQVDTQVACKYGIQLSGYVQGTPITVRLQPANLTITASISVYPQHVQRISTTHNHFQLKLTLLDIPPFLVNSH